MNCIVFTISNFFLTGFATKMNRVANINQGLLFEELSSNAGLLIVAGSETTATLLSGATFFLTSNPTALRRLTEEVRSTFKRKEDITLRSVQSLPYMLACLNESLRQYPPVATGLPRRAPPGGAAIAGTLVPEGVSQIRKHHPSSAGSENQLT